MRGIEGFGFKHHLRTDRLLTLSEDLPLVAVAVDERQRVESLFDDLIKIDHRALLTLERARMLRGEIGAVALPRGAARGDEADRLRRSPGAGLSGTGLRGGV